MNLEFFEFDEKCIPEWDAFVLASSFGSIHQVSAWKMFQEQIPGREVVRGFGVKENNRILAVTFCVRMNTGFLGKYWWYSARGPVFDPKKDKEAGKFLLQNVAEKLRSTKGVFWRFDPYFSAEDLQVYTGSIHSLKITSATQNYQPTDTLEIDLTKSDDQILSEMKRKGRYNINLAQKKGVKIIKIPTGQASQQDIDDFWRLTTETTDRDKFSGHEKSYYKRFLQELKNYAVLFFAEYNHKRIAGAISTFCGEKAIYYFGASTSDPEYRPLMAPYLLQWEMMQYAKAQNCKSYDFLGIAPENEPHHPYAGISEFKWKFGGERRTYVSGREIVFQNMWYLLYRFIKKLKHSR